MTVIASRRHLIPLLSLLLSQPPAHAESVWNLNAPLTGLREPYQTPVSITGATFELEASLTLDQLAGTAASVRFGDRLNFGFDSTRHHFFVEGPAVGETRSLAQAAPSIQPGRPFRFTAIRNLDSLLTLAVNDREIYRTHAVIGPLDTITFRPHRNTLAIHSLKLSGSIQVPEPGLTLQRTVIPILTDGKPKPLLELTLVLDRPRTLTAVTITPGTRAGSSTLSSLALDFVGGWTATDAGAQASEIILRGNQSLAPGIHRFRLTGAIRPGTNLLETLSPACTSITFADGETLRPHPASLPPLRLAYPIHQRGQFACHTFRIPGIARANDGSLLAVYDMRYNSARDLQEHMDIGLSRSTDCGNTWSDPVTIMDMGEFGGKPQQENGCSDPNILVDPKTGEIFVTAVWTHGKPGTHQWRGKGSEPGHGIHQSSQFMLVRSTDHGKSWSAPDNLTTQLKDPAWHLFAPAPGNGIALRNGTLVIPTQGRDAQGVPFSNITWSRDHGKSWTVSNHARSNTTECAVAELSDGALLLNMRDNRNRSDQSATNGRALSITRDLGKTWTIHPADHGALPEPVCMASMISHQSTDGRHLLIFSNPRHKSSRRDITLQISLDDGKSWPASHHLLLDSPGGMYSSLVMIDDHTLGILYESSQADLVFQKIPLADLR
jgi:sialidase-1